MKLLYLVVVCSLLLGRKAIAHTPNYEWNCTDPYTDEEVWYIPSQRYDLQSDTTVTVALTVGRQLNIYTVGDLTECHGEVTAIEFCYQYNTMGVGESYFNWTVLILEDDGSSDFRIADLYAVESCPGLLEDDSCTIVNTNKRRCCDKKLLNTPFTLQTNFTFGVTESVQGNNAQLLGFFDTLAGHVVNTVQLSSGSVSVGSTLPRAPVIDRGLRMLWFVVEPTGTTATTPIDAVSHLCTSTSTPPTDASTTTMETTDDESISTSTESSSSEQTATTVAMVVPSQQASSSLGPAIGGAVGGVIAVALITILVVIIVILAVKRGQMGSQKVHDNAGRAPGYNNALYATADANGKDDNVKLQLDGRGNEGVSFSNISYEYVADTQTKGNELGHDYSLPTDVPRPALAGQTAKEAVPSNAFSDSNVYATAYEVAVPQSQTLKSPNTGSSGYEEDIYMVPASDEHSLYGQLSQINIHTFTRDTIRLTGLLGSGQFGQVHRGEWTDKVSKVKNDVAVKMLKEGADELEKVKFLQEAAIMGQFSHPNVVKLYGVITEGEPVMLIIELLLKGDLRDILCAARTGQSSDLKVDSDLPHTLLSFCRQIAAGMAYLSSKAFVHRDLAARNILVSEDGTCKIADFGMSRDLADTDYYVSHGGKIPVKWTSPEALHFKKYSTASDVWSYGCVMYEIWSLGRKPFENLSNLECMKVVEKGLRLPPPPGCPRILYRLMIDCWHPESSSRPGFVSIVQQLSLPDTKILKWSEEDKTAHPEVSILGVGLERATELYKDLQEQYTTK